MPLPLIFMALMYAYFTKNKKRAKRVGIWALICLYFCSNTLFVNQLLIWFEGKIKTIELQKPVKVGVVLAGGMTRLFNSKTNHIWAGRSFDRAAQALQLYRENKIENIVISGGLTDLRGSKSHLEGDAVQAFLLKSGVPSEHIFLETESKNTHENAVNSAKLLKKEFGTDECVVITSAFHLHRTVGCFKKVGISPIPCPAHFLQQKHQIWFDKLAPSEESLYDFYTIWHEMIGIVVYKIVGYM